eukprot:scaffold2208_cov170-Ochromonas_danica.AAC.36
MTFHFLAWFWRLKHSLSEGQKESEEGLAEAFGPPLTTATNNHTLVVVGGGPGLVLIQRSLSLSEFLPHRLSASQQRGWKGAFERRGFVNALSPPAAVGQARTAEAEAGGGSNGRIKVVKTDLYLILPTHSEVKNYHLDVAMGNPAAPRYRAKAPHLNPDVVNMARDQEKQAHYEKHTTLVGRNPQVYFTFDVEATGRLGPSSLEFLQDIYRSNGGSFNHEGILARFGPSSIMKLLRNLVPAIAKVNAKLSKTVTLFTSVY